MTAAFATGAWGVTVAGGVKNRVTKATKYQVLAAAGNMYSHGDFVCGDPATGLAVPGTQKLGLVPIGHVDYALDLTNASAPAWLDVEFPEERTFLWFGNAPATDEILPSEMFADAYFVDARTLSGVATGTVNGAQVGRSKAGRIWRVGASLTSPVPGGAIAPPIGDDGKLWATRGLVAVEMYK